MAADAAIKKALSGLGLPVARLRWDGGEDAFITYQILDSYEDDHADDESHAHIWTYRVDIYKRGDYMSLMQSAVKALKAAGFYGISIGPEMYENDTKYSHLPIEADYMEGETDQWQR